jgi:hypothetical protein
MWSAMNSYQAEERAERATSPAASIEDAIADVVGREYRRVLGGKRQRPECICRGTLGLGESKYR